MPPAGKSGRSSFGRHFHQHSCPSPLLRLRPYPASMRLNELARDGQAQSAACARAAPVLLKPYRQPQAVLSLFEKMTRDLTDPLCKEILVKSNHLGYVDDRVFVQAGGLFR